MSISVLKSLDWTATVGDDPSAVTVGDDDVSAVTVPAVVATAMVMYNAKTAVRAAMMLNPDIARVTVVFVRMLSEYRQNIVVVVVFVVVVVVVAVARRLR